MSKDKKPKNSTSSVTDAEVLQPESAVEDCAADTVIEVEAGVEQVVDENTAETPPEASEQPARPSAPVAQPAGGGGKALSTLALLVALAGAGLSGWTWYEGQQQSVAAAVPAPAATDYGDAIEKQAGQLQGLLRQTDTYKEQISRLEQQLAAVPRAAELAENQRLLVQLQSAQQAFTRRFEQAFGNTRQDWRLAEAEHLLRMAHLRLTALQDLSSARYLLEAADQILFEQDDPAAYAAREAMAQALTAVRAVPKLDRTGVFMRLGALNQQVGSLSQTLPGYTPGDSDTGSIDWSKLLDKASNYIRLDINSDTEAVKPLLSSQQLIHIRLAVSLSLEQAQWAALNGQQAVYDQALTQAGALLQDYFAADYQPAAHMREQVQELAGASVSQSMPDINPALLALQAYIQERTLEQRAPAEASQ
ncbi:MAG: uroporphyrinogen-III C-methyltransferase [Thiopseudomonas sp.]|nr:uroporphyrinogen-III C-methyltransferase [Thiopseudomonas sp.]